MLEYSPSAGAINFVGSFVGSFVEIN